MTFSGTPFSVEGIRKGLSPDQAASADALAQQRRMVALDDAEIREIELAVYLANTPSPAEATPSIRPSRTILDRLLRR